MNKATTLESAVDSLLAPQESAEAPQEENLQEAAEDTVEPTQDESEAVEEAVDEADAVEASDDSDEVEYEDDATEYTDEVEAVEVHVDVAIPDLGVHVEDRRLAGVARERCVVDQHVAAAEAFHDRRRKACDVVRIGHVALDAESPPPHGLDLLGDRCDAAPSHGLSALGVQLESSDVEPIACWAGIPALKQRGFLQHPAAKPRFKRHRSLQIVSAASANVAEC